MKYLLLLSILASFYSCSSVKMRNSSNIIEGGFVDTNTGFYIEPIEKNYGRINKQTGEYIAPQGLKLDAKKGFVTKHKSLKLEQLALKLNKSLKKQSFIN